MPFTNVEILAEGYGCRRTAGRNLKPARADGTTGCNSESHLQRTWYRPSVSHTGCLRFNSGTKISTKLYAWLQLLVGGYCSSASAPTWAWPTRLLQAAGNSACLADGIIVLVGSS